jgi:hypothetical protein
MNLLILEGGQNVKVIFTLYVKMGPMGFTLENKKRSSIASYIAMAVVV